MRSAAFGVGAANLLARITGMAREIVVTAIFGAGAATDAYNAALRIPQILRELLAEGSLQNAYVPAFSDVAEKEGTDGAWRLANAFLGVLLVALGAATLLFFAAAPLWVRAVASGYADDATKFALTVTLTRWLSPFLAGLSLAGFAAAMLNVRGRFVLPALATNALNVCVIAAALAAEPFARITGLPPIVAVAAGTTLSGFAQLALCAPALLRDGWRPRPTLRGHPGLRRMLHTLVPALIGIGTVQFNLLVETQWASAYGDGALTWMTLAFRLVQLPLAVVAGSVATVALAELSLHAARGDAPATGDALARALRVNSLWTIPSAVGLGVLAEPLVRLFFERGAFSPEDTAGTAALLQMYAFAVFGICFHRVAVPVYYALGTPQTPMRLSIAAMVAKIPVILLLERGFGMGIEALPLSHAITVTGECALLAYGFADRARGRGLIGAHARIVAASLAMGAVAWGLRDALPVVLTCGAAGAVYLVVAWGLGLRDFGRAPPGLPPTVDADTRAALGALAAGRAEARESDDGVWFVAPEACWRLVARDGVLTAIPAADPPAGDAIRAGASAVHAILRPGAPPRLRGVDVAGRCWHADGDALRAGEIPGPRIAAPPLSAAPRPPEPR
jgi:putative peptidoglycan lipid II flippase